jgi:hypothetical protein
MIGARATLLAGYQASIKRVRQHTLPAFCRSSSEISGFPINASKFFKRAIVVSLFLK